MGMAWDRPVIDEEDFKKISKLKGEVLTKVRQDEYKDDLILEFESKQVRISMQDSENYGTNVFFWIEKKKR